MDNQETGKIGEDIAVEDYMRRGYEIVGRNVRTKHGEIDFVCRKKGTLCFVEVKTRRSDAFGYPEEAITRKKRERLFRCAALYLAVRRPPGIRRTEIHVVSLLINKGDIAVQVYENVY